MGKPVTIPLAHDFNCGWCWVGLKQARRLREVYGVEFEWRGYELYPEDLPWPEPAPVSAPPDRPSILSRFQYQLLMDGLDLPAVERPKRMRTFNAHQAVEFVRDSGNPIEPLVEALYHAFWEQGRVINDIEVLAEVAEPFVDDVTALVDAVRSNRFRDRTVKFDAGAYESGVWNVPTFWIGGERYAEQPYSVLSAAVADLMGTSVSPDAFYSPLEFPSDTEGRPYVFINMVATIDGKILTGGRDEPVVDLGSKFDHEVMRRIESAADAVMLGAQTLRAAKPSWNPRAEIRIVVSRSGNLPFDSCFFSGKPFVASPSELPEFREGIGKLRFQDLSGLLGDLRSKGIERLLVLGGSTLNAQLFELGVVDEIFLTVAPKIKLGKDVPTIADGQALPRERIQGYRLLEKHQVGDELFLRYRRNY